MSDDGFHVVQDIADVERGDLVVYYDEGQEPTHVGIIIHKPVWTPETNAELKVLSKWGAFGEYIHDLSEVPRAYGQRKEFWSDRRTV